MTTPTLRDSSTNRQAALEPGPGAETPASRWKALYRVGGVAALLAAAMTVVGVLTYLVWPPPADATVTDWFTLFQRNWLIGMLGLDLAVLLAFVSLIPVVVALYVALRRGSDSLVTLAAPLGLVAIATYFASSRLFEMLALSQQYAAATTDAQRALLAAAGQLVLTTYLGAFATGAPVLGWNYQGTAFNLSFVLWCVAGVLFSVAMLRSSTFGKAAGYAGMAGNALALGLFLPAVGVFLSLLSLPLSLVWYALIARGLFRLGRGAAAAQTASGARPGPAVGLGGRS